MKRKIISIILALVLITTLIMSTSCALIKGPITDEQLREILTELLPKDAQLNGYIWGDSFKTVKTPTENDLKSFAPVYYEISSDSPYENIEQFKAAVVEVYSLEMQTIINQYAFENSETIMSRFCDDVDDDNNVIGIRMDVTENHMPYKLTTTAYVNTAVVKRSTNYMIEAEINITAEGSETVRQMEISLLYEDGAWKINNQTWVINVNFE